jgi:hypothetical protein
VYIFPRGAADARADSTLGRGLGRDIGVPVARGRLALRLRLLLPLHAPVLEPDLNLAFGQAERVRDLDAAPPGEVAIEVELLLELEGLESRVRLTASFPLCNK